MGQTELQPAPPPSAPSNPQEKRTWKVGSLTYTAGGLAILFMWLLWGDFAWALKERSVASSMQIMLKKFEAADWVMGVLLGALPPAIAMLFCPIISYQSDRYRSRWGRRIPFLIIPAPIAALALIGIGLSPWMAAHLHDLLGTHSPGLNGCTLILFAVFWTLFDFASVTANAIFVALINDVVPTEVVGRFFGAMRIVSLAAGMGFQYWLLGNVETYYLEIFVGVGLIFGVGFSLMCLNVKEGDYPPPPPRESKGGFAGFKSATATYLKTVFSQPYYLLVFVFMAVPSVAFLPINLFSIFFAKSINVDLHDLGKWTAIMFLISAIISYPLGVLADKFHPLRVGMVMLAIYAALALWGGLFISETTTFAISYVSCGVLAGAWMTTTLSLPQRLLPKGKFAEYFSAIGIVNCVAQIAIGPSLGVFLDVSGHIYRYTYLVSFIFAAACLFVGLLLHRRFVALGGLKSYVAPEPAETKS